MTKLQPNRRIGSLAASIAAVLGLQGCEPERNASTTEGGSDVTCISHWSGQIQYDGQSLKVQACLNADNCSDEIELVLDWDAQRPQQPSSCGPSGAPSEQYCREKDPNTRSVAKEYENFLFAAYVRRSSEATSASLMEFVAFHEYTPAFASTLTNADRATLTVTGDDGEVIVESVSAVPYAETPIGELETCRALRLDLDGTPVPEAGEP
jgi:hypothetical protein